MPGEETKWSSERTRMECAELVEQMVRTSPWRDQIWARASLSIAARAIRRGRLLTNEERDDNLRAALWAEGIPV